MALNEKFFKSSDVTIYPCSYRGTDGEKVINAKARLITEEGFVQPAIFGDVKSYIVNASDDKLKVVIGGYYFEINDYKGSWTHLYIKTKEITTNDEEQYVLASLNSDTENVLDKEENGTYYFVGLAFGTAIAENCTGLQIFNSDGSIKNESYLPSYDIDTGNFWITGNKTELTHTAAFGTGTEATTLADQFAIGHYNDDSVNALFIVGNGDNEKSKSNAFSTGSKDGTKINENTKITGTLDVSGKSSVDSELEVTGKTTLNNELEVNGATILNNTLDVEKELTAKEEANFIKSINIGKAEAEKYHSSIDALGNATFDETIKAKKAEIGESGAKIEGTLEVTGKAALKELDTASITNTGDLKVTGSTTLSDGLKINQNGAEITGKVIVNGTLEAKANDTDEKTSRVLVQSEFLDLIYPVGSIYTIDAETYDRTYTYKTLKCPLENTVGGTWELIKDRFLYAVDKKVTDSIYIGGSNKAYLVKHDHEAQGLKCTVKDPVIATGTFNIGGTYGQTYIINKTINNINSWTGDTTADDADDPSKYSNDEIKWKKDILTDVFYLPGGEFHRYSAATVVDYHYKKDGDDAYTHTYFLSHDNLRTNNAEIYSSGNHIVIGDGHNDANVTPCLPLKYNSENWVEPTIEWAWTTDTWKLQEAQMRPYQYYNPNAIKINMAHVHLADMSGNTAENGTVDPADSTANMPAYRKVYAWIRTE